MKVLDDVVNGKEDQKEEVSNVKDLHQSTESVKFEMKLLQSLIKTFSSTFLATGDRAEQEDIDL